MRSLLVVCAFLFFLTSCATKRSGTLSSPNHKNGTTIKNNSSSGRSGGTSITGLNYIETYKEIAIREMNQYGIPASIKLAQAILESGNGNSYLAREANNHFGIKCGGVWTGKSVTRSDDSPNDCFRMYRDPEESFKDHSQFLLRKRYEKLFALNKDDYKGWARGLKEAGYATNPRYPELLIDLIERYELYKYDKVETYVEKERREEKLETIIAKKVITEPTVKEEQMKTPIAMIIHEVKASQTLYSIGKQFGVSVDTIKELNNLTNENLAVGQLLVISK